MAISSILLRGGVVLSHGTNDEVVPLRADVLIRGNEIVKIGQDIDYFPETDVIDCSDKILCPGFIDTHHHLWQTLLKGRHANETLIEYFTSGNFPSAVHSPEDIFWGQLGGALECLNAGTTTVVDHSHVNCSPEHTHAALAATVSSGLRAVYCYCPTPTPETWEPFTFRQDLLAPWVLQTLEDISSKAPYGDGRVRIGLAFDAIWLPKEPVTSLFEKAKSLGVKVITIHNSGGLLSAGHSVAAQLKEYGLLDSSILLSHATNVPAGDFELIRSANAHISTTPSTELQMMGGPMAFSDKHDIQSHASIGVDCHSATSASMVSEMRLLLQSARGQRNARIAESGKIPWHLKKSVREVFNLATIAGARAIGQEATIGSLAEGKMADLVIFDALSPAMIGAAQEDPVAAVVLHSSPADIEMTIVDGVIRKRHGRLMDVAVAKTHAKWTGDKESLAWAAVAKEIIVRRESMAQTLARIDMTKATEGLMRAWHMDPDRLADSV